MGTIDRYGHEDDAIERFQALKQRLFVESIRALAPVMRRIIEQCEKANEYGANSGALRPRRLLIDSDACPGSGAKNTGPQIPERRPRKDKPARY